MRFQICILLIFAISKLTTTNAHRELWNKTKEFVDSRELWNKTKEVVDSRDLSMYRSWLCVHFVGFSGILVIDGESGKSGYESYHEIRPDHNYCVHATSDKYRYQVRFGELGGGLVDILKDYLRFRGTDSMQVTCLKIPNFGCLTTECANEKCPETVTADGASVYTFKG